MYFGKMYLYKKNRQSILIAKTSNVTIADTPSNYKKSPLTKKYLKFFAVEVEGFFLFLTVFFKLVDIC